MLKDIFRQFFCKSALVAILVKVTNRDYEITEVTDTYLEQAGMGRAVFFTEMSKYLLPGFTNDEKNNKIIFDGLIRSASTNKSTAVSFFSESLKRSYDLTIKPLDKENGGEQYFILTVIPVSENVVLNDKSLEQDYGMLSMERFNYLVRDGLDMIAVLDDIGNYRYVSNTSLAVLGFGPDYFMGRNAFEFIHPEDIEEAKYALQGIEGKSRVTLKPFRFQHQNGSWRWIETVLSDLRNEPSIKGIVANSRDVTEQINVRNDVLISNERYKYVTKATSEAIWDWDIVSGSLLWGEGFIKLFGYSAAEIETAIDTFYAKIHPEDFDRIKDNISKLLENKESRWFNEYRLKKADGEYAFIVDKGLVIFDKEGTPIRMVGAMQDVTKKKQEEQRLKLLESVVLNTTDSVAIMSVDLTRFPISQIIYVNEAFSKMTGYSYDELIGKSPRILEGPRTDQEEVNRLIGCLLKGIPCEATLINYKKNKEEFWLNLSVTPIADNRGIINRWISIQRDITEEKTETIRQKLISVAGMLFNRFPDMKKATSLVLDEISTCGNFCNAELWLPDANENYLRLFSKSKSDKQIEDFYAETTDFTIAKKGEGLVGKVWQDMKPFDINLSDATVGGRVPAAIKIGIKHIYGLPLSYNGKLIGVLALAVRSHHNLEGMAVLSDNFAEFLAGEVKRKLLEQVVGEVFEFAPDILATLDYKGYFKRINRAATQLLGYSESELLNRRAKYFVHPLDRFATARKIKKISDGDKSLSFENRYVTKSGQVKWLSWTANAISADGLIFAVAKDITEKKTLADLLQKTNSLARIGSWEINVAERTVYWSDVTKEIREAGPDFEPDLDTGIQYFKEGFNKDTIKAKVQNCMDFGTPWDEELEIVTFKGNLKWVRTIGQAEMVGGKCIRIFGSFQDIDARKRAEILNKEILREVAESEKKYSELFHFSPLPMWVYDLETLRFLDVNLSAIKHYGYTRQEFLKITIHDILVKDEFPAIGPMLENIGIEEAPYSRGIYKHITKNGVVIQVDIRSNPMFFKGKEARLVVAADITKELLYVKEIEEKNSKLQEIAWIQSHTVRAPLARIMGLVDMLTNNKKQKVMSQADILKHIESSAEELDKIIKEITVKSDKTN